MSKHLLIVSTSTVYGKGYLGYMEEEIKNFFGENKNIVFIPYARPGGISHDEYTEIARKKFEELGLSVKGIHEFENPKKAIAEADGFFTGGGNTYVLLKQLYENGLIEPLRNAVENGKPYMGTSAGSNITGLSICTTNDMPIVYPPSFKALQLVPFNINPHYLDPNPDSKHMGETRETRIKEFHFFNDQPVVGIREGSWLEVMGEDVTLCGELSARIFEQGKEPYEVPTGSKIKF
ncbi:dipeptidase PepE [Sediminitomix flava]|uniref:dipeptidase E n=1 Tax=Sediminitomix flava TaxID=379075 RepID=A0A315Z6J1_SEDFL|nr:dipeptidase PepE [Sediminitomix flava]PWJ40007.1 dipeptidase E [Sediminitomix flava]